MSTLTIPDLDESTLASLRDRAERAGRTIEDVARAVLSASMLESPPHQFDRAEAKAAAEALRRLVMQANGGRMPDDSVDQFIAEKRAEVASEEAAFAASLVARAKWSTP
jgi:plasmid stability protein